MAKSKITEPRNRSVKLLLTETEERKLTRRAKSAGHVGRGAIVSYIREREELPAISPGAKPGNQNRAGKTKPLPRGKK